MQGPIVYFTDGSHSAREAGRTAVEMALACQAPLHAIFILDKGWGSMMGDEWINTSSTRMTFYHWFEGELNKGAEKVLQEFESCARESGVSLKAEVLAGDTEKLMAETANIRQAKMVVLPNPHATADPAAAGLRFNLNSLAKKVQCPIMVGPNIKQ